MKKNKKKNYWQAWWERWCCYRGQQWYKRQKKINWETATAEKTDKEKEKIDKLDGRDSAVIGDNSDTKDKEKIDKETTTTEKQIKKN